MAVEVPEDNPYIHDPPTDFQPVERTTAASAREEIELLREAIRYHDYKYYIEDDPVIADSVYDVLFERLEELEDAFSMVEESSPTQRVAPEPADTFDTVEHAQPMLSLDASGEASEVRHFDTRVRKDVGPVEYVLEPKFDGVSIELVYEDGRFVRAVTRGDGYEGDEVTQNVKTIQSVPMELFGEPPSFLSLRGEIYMPKDGFQAYNRERVQSGKDPFANPRNAAAGTLRQLDASVVAERPLSCFVFDVLEASDPWDTRWEEHQSLEAFGLPVNDRVQKVEDIEGALSYRDELLEIRDTLNYEIDGVVIKVNDRQQREALGQTARFDRGAYAYKFPPRTEVTPIRDITVQIGRTGRATPLALLEPVDVGGVTVSRASLHNFEEIKRKNVNVNDMVRVERAGDVIPYVAEVVEKRTEGHFEPPAACPICGNAIEFSGPLAYCSGRRRECRAQLRESVIYFASDQGLDIDGLGEESVRQFLEAGLITTDIADLFELKQRTLQDLPGWGNTSANKLIDELEKARSPSLDAFIAALGIPEVGPTIARQLAGEFQTLEELAAAEQSELEDVEDIGPTVANAIVAWFADEENQELLQALEANGVRPEPVDLAEGDRFEDLRIVITGTLPTLTRDEARERIEREGGRVTGSVSGATDYLVVGENPGERKLSQAEEHDVETIAGDQFESWIAGTDDRPRQATLEDRF